MPRCQTAIKGELRLWLDFKWRSQPKIWGREIFYFRRATVFCLRYRLSKHAKNLGSMIPWALPGYAYVSQKSGLRFWTNPTSPACAYIVYLSLF